MYNKVILVGRLTKDPETNYLDNGTPVCKYSLAVNRNFKNSQGQYETDFINIVSWRKLAEISQKYLKKGKLTLVEGSIQTRSYQAQDGTKKYITEVQAEKMQMLDPKKQGEGESGDPETFQANRNKVASSLNGKITPLGDELPAEEVDFEDVPF